MGGLPPILDLKRISRAKGVTAHAAPPFVGRGHPRRPPCLKLDWVRLSVVPAWGLSATPTQGASDTRHPDTSTKRLVQRLSCRRCFRGVGQLSDTSVGDGTPYVPRLGADYDIHTEFLVPISDTRSG